jgi:hypothetical protein
MKYIRTLVCSLAFGALGTASAFAATTSQTSVASQPTANYTNSWEQSRTVDTYATYWPNSSLNYGFNSFHGSSFNRYWDSPAVFRTYERAVSIYFPMEPIFLGQVLPMISTKPRNSVLAQMRPYLSDLFFPAMTAYMHDESLSNKRLQRITDYRAEKQRLLMELRTRIDQIRQADPASRASLYAEFAAQQKPLLVALEAKEEEIRRDFTSGGIFSDTVDWNDTRSWRLGDDSRYESYMDEYLVMRAAVYFQRWLSTPQRDLLREVSMELLQRGQDPTNELSIAAAGPFFYFSPASSRFRLPLEMPDELRAKIDQYQALKQSLKRELRDTIYKQDGSMTSTRNNAVKELAAQQEPRLAQLDDLAEQIRVGLVSLKLPDEPDQSTLPPVLGNQISAYLQAKIDLSRTLRTRLSEVQAILPKDRIEIVSLNGGYGIEIVATRGKSKDEVIKRENVRAQLAAFNSEQAQRFQALSVQNSKLRAEIKQMSKNGSVEVRSVDQLISDFSLAFARQEIWNRYKDYRIAILEPGLCPEQRRLLYGSAIETLMGDYMSR